MEFLQLLGLLVLTALAIALFLLTHMWIVRWGGLVVAAWIVQHGGKVFAWLIIVAVVLIVWTIIGAIVLTEPVSG